jgi:Protein of unknown function (DUF1566)
MEVKDLRTGLIWQRCSVGQYWDGATCAGDAKIFSFDEAPRLARNGWRLPAIRELASLIYCSSGRMRFQEDPKDGGSMIGSTCGGEYSSPTINSGAFPNNGTYIFWSGSPNVSNSRDAWVVSFNFGFASEGFSRRDFFRVRLVRSDP